MLEMLKKHTVDDDSCTLCFDAKATVKLLPCSHKGFCFKCSAQLETCPMCRGTIFQLMDEDELIDLSKLKCDC